MRRRLIVVLTLVVLVATAIAAGVVSTRTQEPVEPADAQDPPAGPDIPSLNRDLAIEDSEVIAYGTVKTKLYIELSDDEIATLNLESPRFLNRIVLLGWQREGNRFSRVVPARDVSLRFGDEVILVKDGRYAFLAQEHLAPAQRRELRETIHRRSGPVAAESRSTVPFVLAVDGEPIPTSQLEIDVETDVDESSPLRIDVVERIEFREMRAQMHTSHAIATNAGEPMERCMDYNGPMSDGKNHKATDPRAWRNFVCSDCDLAGAGRCVSCWRDHKAGGCEKKHGKVCSKYIGHSSSYHKHKWSQCKYCI